MKAYAFALLTALFWGLGPVLGKIGLYRIEPLTGLALRSLVISSIIAPYAVITGRMSGLGQVGLRPILFISAEGLCASLLGHLAYYYTLKYGEASRLIPVTAAYPLVTIVVAVALLGEQFTWSKLVGALMIIAGILIIRY